MSNLAAAKRRVNMILTSLGLRQKGFYTPYNYMEDKDWDIAEYPVIRDDFRRRVPAFRAFLGQMDAKQSYFLSIQADEGGPNWNGSFLSRLDAAAIYTGLSVFRPKQLIEVGSGNSTHFICRAIADHGLKTEVTCIDPAPRVDIGALPVTVVQRALSVADLDLIATLEPGDILFVDSSHLMQQGLDVDILFNRAFPILPVGAIVHVHDIFLPYGYPSAWRSHRFNEQLALVGLIYAGFFETLFASHFAWRDMRDDLRAICQDFPLDTPENGGTVWLRKGSPVIQTLSG